MSPEAVLRDRLIAAGQINLDDIPRLTAKKKLLLLPWLVARRLASYALTKTALFGEEDRVLAVQMAQPGLTVEKD